MFWNKMHMCEASVGNIWCILLFFPFFKNPIHTLKRAHLLNAGRPVSSSILLLSASPSKNFARDFTHFHTLFKSTKRKKSHIYFQSSWINSTNQQNITVHSNVNYLLRCLLSWTTREEEWRIRFWGWNQCSVTERNLARHRLQTQLFL